MKVACETDWHWSCLFFLQAGPRRSRHHADQKHASLVGALSFAVVSLSVLVAAKPRITEAFPARWRAKQKSAAFRKGQCPKDQKEPLFPGSVTVIHAKTHGRITRNGAACGKLGHWRGDAVCGKNKHTENLRRDESEKNRSYILLVHWTGGMSMEVYLSETEDERAAALQKG